MDDLQEMAVAQHLQHMSADIRRTGLFPSLCVLLDEACKIILQKKGYTKVVRCKDCKHREDGLCPMESVEQYPWFATKNDGFCSYGERRNDGVQ